MKVLERTGEATDFVWRARAAGQRVAVVPTMGALHAGHLSLVQHARQSCDCVTVSIFVNPTQFGVGEDFDRYPRTLEEDVRALQDHGADLVFAPSLDEMYPPGATTMVDPPQVAGDLEGKIRPGHFRGVATVVLKLFQVLPAQLALFGEKDYQQCLVIRDMVRDLLLPIDLEFCPTIREADGLAMSSRNRYLTPEQRPRALGLSQGLALAQRLVTEGQRDVGRIETEVAAFLEQSGVDRIDYVALRDAETLSPIEQLQQPAVLLLAARVGSTRLIDNGRLHP